MKHLYVFFVLIAGVSAFKLSDLTRDEWNTYKLQHKKRYDNATEESRRLKIYLENRNMIAKHNDRYYRGLETYSLKINQFSDMTHEEYLKIALGFIPNERRKSRNPEPLVFSPANVVINESVDWRLLGAVSSVGNQLQCKSCWAFSATGALEGQLFRKNKVLFELSVQNLLDCSKANNACESGNMHSAFKYIKRNRGIDVEMYYPYEGKESVCRYNPKYSGGYDVGYQKLPVGNETRLMEAVATIGPVSVAIDGSQPSFSQYSHGVYYDKSCSSQLNHAMLVVGYGRDKVGGDYWILKNSYGTEWGEDGYMRLARNRHNHCNIASYASYPLVPKDDLESTEL